MVRARIWFRCAAVGDPVSPVLLSPARISWEGREGEVDVVIDGVLKGEELLGRMKGWITVDPFEVIPMIRPLGRLKVLDERVLVVEFEDRAAYEKLSQALNDAFPDRVDLEPLTPLD